MNKKIIFAVLCIILSSCQNYVPKPIGYFRIELKEKNYIPFNDNNYPICFEYADIANISQTNTEWFDIVYPDYNARIYCSYLPIKDNFYEISEDSRSFVYKHTIKADAIAEIPFENVEKNVYGILYDIKGNTASSVQFVLTDSTNHFMRGALYFNNRPNKDSLAPIINYIKEDIEYLIETTSWKNVNKQK